MPDISSLEANTYRQTNRIYADRIDLPLRDGPTFIAQIPASQAPGSMKDSSISAEQVRSLFALAPGFLHLDQLQMQSDGWLAASQRDSRGEYAGYLYAGHDGSIELVAAFTVGPWGNERRSWSTTAYELPLLNAFSVLRPQAPGPLDAARTTILFMSLTRIAGTAIVTDRDGIELPIAFPPVIESLHFEPVDISDPATKRDTLTTSLNRVRSVVGLTDTKPFYF